MSNPSLPGKNTSTNAAEKAANASGQGRTKIDEDSSAWGKTLIPAGAKFYWKMLPPKKGSGSGGQPGKMAGYGPAPRLSPASESNDPTVGDHMNDTTGPSTHVNIRDVHHWTESPTHSRREVPMLMLKEYRILTNPMLNQVMNNVGIAVQTGTGLVQQGANAANLLSGLAKGKDGKFTANTTIIAENIDRKMKEQIGSGAIKALEGTDSGYANPLNPYSMLYTVSPTKFKYTFPYMEDAYIQKSGGFGAGTEGGFMTDITSIVAEGLSDISAKKVMAPGRMIEQPKGFTFDGRERSYTVKFPLFNTKDFTEIIRNWQFIYLLTYQNTPNRITRDLIDPPCIYEAKIPGVWYSKYASITNMQVDFVGGRREMDMPVPYLTSAEDGSVDGKSESNWLLQKRKITTVIPDAYMVTITVTELFSETQNFMYHMVKESMSDRIKVTNTQY